MHIKKQHLTLGGFALLALIIICLSGNCNTAQMEKAQAKHDCHDIEVALDARQFACASIGEDL